MTEEGQSRGLDRSTLLKRAAVAAAAASVPLAKTPRSWAGLTKPAAQKPLRVGNLLTLSGPNAGAGQDIKKGFVSYVLSHGHRLGGRKIQFVDADDAQNPANAIQQVQKLASDSQVDVIEGIVFSNILLAVRDTIDQLKIPTVVDNAGANVITRERKSDYIFRTSWTNYMDGVVLGAWAARKLAKDGMVVIAANFAAGQEQSAGFRAAYTNAGGQLAGDTIFFPFPVTPDYQPFISQIQGRNPKAVWVFCTGGGETIKFVKTYQQLGLGRVPLIGTVQLTDPQSILDAEGSTATDLDIHTSGTFAPNIKLKENQTFVNTYKRFGGVPSSFAECGYVAAQYLDAALKKIHGDTSNKARFLKALENPGTIHTPGGPVTMNPDTHQAALPYYLLKPVKTKQGLRNQAVAGLGKFLDPGHS